MKKIYLVILFIVMFVGCRVPTLDWPLTIADVGPEDFDYEQIGDSIPDITGWIFENISYKTDHDVWGREDYWQTPKQTLELRTGDCEDTATLLLWIMYKKDYNMDSAFMIIYTVFNGHANIMDFYGYHAIVMYEGIYYEPRSYWPIRDNISSIEEVYTFKEAMRFSEAHEDPIWKNIKED